MSVAVLSAGVGHVRASDRLRHGVLRRLFPGEKKKKKGGCFVGLLGVPLCGYRAVTWAGSGPGHPPVWLLLV